MRALLTPKTWPICILLVSALCLGSTGCSRTPSVAYYTLTPPLAAETSSRTVETLPKIVVVLPTIPALIDRNEFTELGDGNRVIVHEDVRWAVGLRKTIRDYFIAHLKQSIPALDISSSANQAVVPGGRKLLMIFDRFTIRQGQYVEIAMNWRLLGGESRLLDQSNSSPQVNEITIKQDITSELPSDAIAAIRVALDVIGEEMTLSLTQ